jgi:tRNA dimethylallyltransferase
MSPAASAEALVITGPTGTGKSDLAVEVALRLNGEIISADSRQLYRDMDIGTAKPPRALREKVPHHGFDQLDPDDGYSAGRFAADAWRCIAELRRRDRLPVLVGGTGFFIRALLAPLGPEPVCEPERRARLRRYLSDRPVDELKTWLGRLDPQRARQLSDEGGSQRLARSLEVVLASGRSHSWWFAQPAETTALAARVFCLSLPREELYRSIDERYERMLTAGLLEEVRGLLQRFPAESPGLKSVGYAELVLHLRGECTLEEAVEEAKRNTRRFARRQLTWFRHQLPEDTVWLAADRPLAELTDEVVRAWRGRTEPLAG